MRSPSPGALLAATWKGTADERLVAEPLTGWKGVLRPKRSSARMAAGSRMEQRDVAGGTQLEHARRSHASAAAPFKDLQQSGRPRSQVRAFQARRSALVQVVEGQRPE
jgi:hypothetical protein